MNLNSPTFLDVAIGLTFIYFILSLLASEIQELIAALFQWRAKHLKQSIYLLLGGSGKMSDAEKNISLQPNDSQPDLKTLLNQCINDKQKAYVLTNNLYENSIIASLSNSSLGLLSPKNNYGPSYISSESFAIALIEVLRKIITNQNGSLDEIKNFLNPSLSQAMEAANQPQPISVNENTLLPQRLKNALYELAIQVKIKPESAKANGSEIYKFQEKIKNWFDRSQNRNSGTYKRQTKVSILIVGFITALVANANIFKIFDSLYHQQTVRDAITQAAVKAVNKCTSKPQVIDSDCINEIKSPDQLPIGWNFSEHSTDSTDKSVRKPKQPKPTWLYLIDLLGYILSGLAITMGAPFWFDLLNKFVNVRNAGPRPPSSTEK